MKAEDVPQKWRTLMIGFLQEAFDEAMLADSYADIERMVDEGVAAVAPLIAAALEAEVTELRRNKGSWEDDARVWQADAMRLRADVAALVEALEWFIDNDDTNEGDTPLPDHGGRTWNEMNAYWLDGLNKARAALAAYRGEAGR